MTIFSSIEKIYQKEIFNNSDLLNPKSDKFMVTNNNIDHIFRLACFYNNKNQIDILLNIYKYCDNIKQVNMQQFENYHSGIYVACMNGNIFLVKYLLQYYKIDNMYNPISINEIIRCLSIAFEKGHSKIVKYIIKLHKFDDKYGKITEHHIEDIIHLIFKSNNDELIKYIINKYQIIIINNIVKILNY